MELIRTLLFVFFVFSLATVDCNSEGDALIDVKTRLTDPNNVLQSWDSTLVNPCTWFHVTCNNKNSVIRVDLGNAGLSGTLSPSLGNLTNLQYLEISSNKISGIIPNQIGYLSKLISLGLDDNRFSGIIPSSFGNLRSLRFLRLQGNYLAGTIPTEVIQLVKWGNLEVMNVSSNMFAGTIRRSNTTTGFVTTTIVQDPKAPKS